MEHHIDPLNPSIEQGIEFLTTLFDAELGYSSINTARSALSSILPMYEGRKFGEHPLVTRFLKGIFELKPALPRYPEIWDVQIVLDHLQSYKPGEELSLKELTLKLTMLLCLLTAQRCQTIQLIDVNDIQEIVDGYRITFHQKVKQTRPGHHLQSLELLQFPQDKKLCVVEHLRLYLARTKDLRGDNTQLLLSFIKPNAPVSKATIARWVKTVLQQAGIDASKYSAHSSRAASTTSANAKGIPLQEIMKCAGWSSDTTFKRFYLIPVQQMNFGNIVLSK
jgi:hypothetical protein